MINQYYPGADAKEIAGIYDHVDKTRLVINAMLAGAEAERLRKMGKDEGTIEIELWKMYGANGYAGAYTGVMSEEEFDRRFFENNVRASDLPGGLWGTIGVVDDDRLQGLIRGGLVTESQAIEYRRLRDKYEKDKEKKLAFNREVLAKCQELGISGCESPNEETAKKAMDILNPKASNIYEEQKACRAMGRTLENLGWVRIDQETGDCLLTDKTAGYKDSETPLVTMVADLAKQNLRLTPVGNFIFFNDLTQGMVARGQDMIDGNEARYKRAREIQAKLSISDQILTDEERAYFDSDEYKTDAEAWKEVRRGWVMKWSPGLAAPVGVVAAVGIGVVTVATGGLAAAPVTAVLGILGTGMGASATAWSLGATYEACSSVGDAFVAGNVDCRRKMAMTAYSGLSTLTGGVMTVAGTALQTARVAGSTAEAVRLATAWNTVRTTATVTDVVTSMGGVVLFGDQAREQWLAGYHTDAVLQGLVALTSGGRAISGLSTLGRVAGLAENSGLGIGAARMGNWIDVNAMRVDLVTNYVSGASVCIAASSGETDIYGCLQAMANALITHMNVKVSQAEAAGARQTVESLPPVPVVRPDIADVEVRSRVEAETVRRGR